MNSENNKGKQENKSKNLNNSKSGADVKNSSLELTPIKRLKRELAYEGTILKLYKDYAVDRKSVV